MDFEYGCEECGAENEKLFDCISDNKALRLCAKCARTNEALILEEEKNKITERYDERFKKKDNKNQAAKEKPAYTFNTLWDRYQKIKAERENEARKKAEINTETKREILDESKFVQDLEKEKIKEKQEIITNIDSEIIPEQKIEQEKEFREQISQKVKIKNFFKQAFSFLKKESEDSNDELIEDIS